MSSPEQPDREITLRRYVLGQLPEAERAQVEEDYFRDDEVYEDLEAIEDELLFDYAQGSLAPDERGAVEQRLLATPRDRERLAFAQALSDSLSVARESADSRPAPSTVRPSTGSGLRAFALRPGSPKPSAEAAGRTVEEAPATDDQIGPIGRPFTKRQSAPRDAWWSVGRPFTGRRMWPALATAASVVILGGAVAWLGVERARLLDRLERAETAARADRDRLEQQVAAERGRRQQADAALQAERSRAAAPRAAAEPPFTVSRPPTLLSLVLAPGLTRGGGQSPRIIMAPAIDVLELLLQLPSDPTTRRYRAIVRTAEGVVVWRGDNLDTRQTARGLAVAASIPATRVPVGDYELTLSDAASRDAEIATYYFSVRR